MAHSGGGWVGKGIDAALGINLDDSTPSPSTSPTRAAPAPLLLYQSQNPSLVSFVTVQAAQPCQGYAGHLSLHEYRKYLSQPDDSTTSSELRGRTLKRKAGTSNLSQARGRRDFSSSISSSFSSVPPSSPPPLSFSQSLQSVTSNVSDPEPEILAGLSHSGQIRSKSISTISSPVSLGQRSDISLPIVMHHEQTSRTHNAFRDRLQKPNDVEPAALHCRSSSDTALGTLELPKTTFHHEGVSFEMINPRDSLEFARVSSSLEDPKHLSLDSSEGRRISTVSAITVGNSGTPTMSPDHSPSNVQLEARLQRPADARRLFDDFPLAHTSGLQNLRLPSPSLNFLESSDPFITLPQSNDWHDTQASPLNLDPFPNQLEYQPHTESHNETLVSRTAENVVPEIEWLEKSEEERKIVESSQFLTFAGSEKTFEQGHMQESDEEEEEKEEADHQPPLPPILPLFTNKNPLLMHPAREDLAHSHHLHEDSQSGRSILVPRYYYEGDPSFPHRNAFTSPVPIALPRGNPPSSSSFSAPDRKDIFFFRDAPV
ncbi:hypothetical protein V8E54_002774 [Elaphomyces granulatus]